MRAGLECNVEELFKNFVELSSIEMVQAVKTGLRKAAVAIKNKTVENARAGIKTYNNHRWDPYQGDSILDAPRVSKIEDRYDEDLYTKVHVMGTSKSDSQTYRFRFLEKGTKDRYQKTYKGKPLTKPRYIGSIKPRHFFKNAVQETNVEQIYLEALDRAIENINNKKR